jgi:hypothetical protein
MDSRKQKNRAPKRTETSEVRPMITLEFCLETISCLAQRVEVRESTRVLQIQAGKAQRLRY